MATYGPGIDQSQHTKSVSHIIRYNYYFLILKMPPSEAAVIIVMQSS